MGKEPTEMVVPWEDPNDKQNKSVPTKPPMEIVVAKVESSKPSAPAESPPREPPPNELRPTTIKPSQAEDDKSSTEEVSDIEAVEEEVSDGRDLDELLDDKDPFTGEIVTLSADGSSGSDSSDSSSSDDSESSESSYIPPTRIKKQVAQTPGSNSLNFKKKKTNNSANFRKKEKNSLIFATLFRKSAKLT